jgi:hypothetical protein
LVALALAGASALFAIACVREGATVVAAVEADVGDAGPAAAYVVTAPPTPAPAKDQCSARLRAGKISTAAGCTLDERISRGNGLLVFPCTGDGSVEATFGEHRFVGQLTGTTMALSLTTELDWDDSCHWETKQGIRGTLKRDGKPPKLVWSYSESPVSGPTDQSHASCFGSCVGKADIEVDDLQH